MKIKHLLSAIMVAFGLSAMAQNDFVRTDGMHFYKGDTSEPYYFVGANFWYGPILGSTGQGGNRQRLHAELDAMQALGINNIRILVGADAGSKNVTSLSPYMQTAPGVYNDTLLVGLDYLLAEMHKRDMVAVIYLTNAWDWSGGYGFYLRATGHGDSPDAHGEGYKSYVKYATEFNNDTKAQELFYNHVRHIVSRTNSITGIPYREDPTIMAWQLCNEPRIFGNRNFDGYKEGFLTWSHKSTALIKSLDKNHLVCTGSEGLIGCDYDSLLYVRQHDDPNVDYLTVHIWPVNWSWATANHLLDKLPNVLMRSGECIDFHEKVAQQLNKPYVIEEFGYSRDNTVYKSHTTTTARDAFYKYIFSKVRESRDHKGRLAGCNFWGWGGMGRPSSETWHNGDDYVSDPPHEPQGWYCVYDTDQTTIKIIREALN